MGFDNNLALVIFNCSSKISMLKTIPFLVGEAKNTPKGYEGSFVIARLDGLMEEKDSGVFVWLKGLSANVDGTTCTGVSIEKIWWQCIGMKVNILFDATSDVLAMQLGENQSGHHDYSSFGGLTNNAGSGKTGDVQFTTIGASSGDTYTVILEVIKSYT